MHLIAGGSLKGGGFTGLREAVGSRCRACYLIGEAAERLEADLAGTVPIERCGDLEHAVDAAAAAARPGEVVLLSPACASYDQFTNFEERGDRFRRARKVSEDDSGRARRRSPGWPRIAAEPRGPNLPSNTPCSTPPRSACWRPVR